MQPLTDQSLVCSAIDLNFILVSRYANLTPYLLYIHVACAYSVIMPIVHAHTHTHTTDAHIYMYIYIYVYTKSVVYVH